MIWSGAGRFRGGDRDETGRFGAAGCMLPRCVLANYRAAGAQGGKTVEQVLFLRECNKAAASVSDECLNLRDIEMDG